jgi:hypothetical protein
VDREQAILKEQSTVLAYSAAVDVDIRWVVFGEGRDDHALN